jgi:hypothetical protein
MQLGLFFCFAKQFSTLKNVYKWKKNPSYSLGPKSGFALNVMVIMSFKAFDLG